VGELTGLKLLLIDDSGPDELVIRRRLMRAIPDFELVQIDQPEQLRQALDGHWDAILYDPAVPHLDFKPTVTALREHLPDTPIILVSGSVDEETTVATLLDGISDFVLKDRLARLPHAIHQAIDASRERTRRSAAELALDKFFQAAEHNPAAILITDTTPHIEYANPAFQRITGYSRDELIGRNPSLLNRGLTPASTYKDLWTTLRQGDVWRGEFHNTCKNGEAYVEEVIIAPVRRADGTITHYVGIQAEATERQKNERLIQRLSFYDALTDLPNRSLLLRRMAAILEAADQRSAYGMVLVLDLDGFKFINDLHGFEVGDRVLVEIGDRLSAEMEEGPVLVARVGGNKFALLVEALGRDESGALQRARTITEQIRRRVDQPLTALPAGASAVSIRPSASIGVSLFRHQENPETILNKAEIALAQARELGRGEWRIFDPALQRALESRMQMEVDLAAAIEGDQFSLALQSVYTCQGRISGAEALLRWQRAPGKFVPPSQFIPVAEACGLIEPIGYWVLQQAAQRLHIWASDPATRSLRLSVNVSARQFFQPDFIRRLRALKRRFDLDPSRMVIELTESVFLENLKLARTRMEQCVKSGFRLALDDFGTGYSSLSYLNHLPFHTLKIDRSFVNDMVVNPRNEEIVRATIALGHALELTVVAEGVETRQQLERLQALGCDFVQGYLLARPVLEMEWTSTDFEPPEAS